MRKPALLLTALVTGLGGLLVAPAAAQAAPVVTTLPFANPADVVSSGDRVFISGGRDEKQIVVTDAAGTITATVDGLDGPTDLELSHDRRTLYVALPRANAIAAFDTQTLVLSARYPTGAGTCPDKLAFGGRHLWFGYGCEAWQGEVGRVDLARPFSVVATRLTGISFFTPPLPATAARNGSVLFVGQQSLSPWTGYSFAIGATGALTKVSQTDHGSVGSDLWDAALDPTGETVYTASSTPSAAQSFVTAALTKAGRTYDTGAGPNAIELNPGGSRLAVGSDAPYGPDVFVFGVGGTAVARFELGTILRPGGLAWAPDGRRLYAIGTAQLHVLPVPAGVSVGA
ncbi:YncE family protein [Paractinoplanes lichenicola]|uniref:40-residue YVTN family beta-propeller repeat-containing protein n=1 Tax=Paractinoplanes lichenicola TaxID=2802976 RepID=A0ABS1VFE0_9ACTN|nr:hypothetical protein [Actinoplanes lichenicola]MBL7253348.1 hypothetical protein [Actinoplanes lichenicola]